MDQVFELTRLPTGVGGEKAQRLAWLKRNGYNTPDGLVVPSDVPNTSSAIADWVHTSRHYVVRSSADGEDGSVHTFAGQFDSILDLSGITEVAAAVAQVRQSAMSARVVSYRADPDGDVSCIVQPMIRSQVGGVVFTRNPVTGLDEVIVEAVVGRSSQLLADGIEPDRWVHRWGEFVSTPEGSPIDHSLVAQVVEAARDIASRFGQPLDLEWIWDGEHLWWVQLRPIGGLDVTVYSNRIAREVLPGAIKPLVWSINVPLVNGAWIRLLEQATGPTGLTVDDLAKPFAHHAYFNMTAMGDIFAHMGMPRDSLELLLGLPEGPEKPSMKPSAKTMRMLPQMLAFAARRGRAVAHTQRVLAEAPQRLAPAATLDIKHSTDGELWQAVEHLDVVVGDIAESNIVVPLLFNIWSGLLRRLSGDDDLAALSVDDEVGSELAEHDPQVWLKRLAEIGESGYADSARGEFIDRFGHLSDSGNDFSTPTWAEQPEVVDKLIAAAGSSTERPPQRTWDEIIADLPRRKRVMVVRLGRQVRRYRVLREAVGSLYTKAYGLYRPLFLEFGARLVARGVTETMDDVFYLTRGQVADPPADAREIVVARRTELEASRELQLPETIFGDDFTPSTRPELLAGMLTGTAASRGRYTGPARVVTSVSQIDDVKAGDVLVVPFSDVGWTPLFASAGAVVAESGGLLSHSSIVAREYGIPCVVSVPGATNIEDGALVTVDGYRGEVEVHLND